MWEEKREIGAEANHPKVYSMSEVHSRRVDVTPRAMCMVVVDCPQAGQAAFHTTEECWPRPGGKHVSGGFAAWFLLHTSFFPWLKLRAMKPVHSGQKADSLIDDFLCLDDK